MSDKDLQSLIGACEKEPIHIPGGIQPYGALLAFSPYFSSLLQVSDNAASFFACGDISRATAHSLINGWVLQRLHEGLQFGERVAIEAENMAYQGYVSGSYWVVEVERLNLSGQVSVRQLLANAFRALREQSTQQGLLDELTRQVKQVSGFERVMVYQFDNEWHGKVTAESTGSLLDSMLGHHFPASDIPPQARAMYSKNPFRIIGSATEPPYQMLALDHQNAEPVDMSQGALRAVSPLHMQYLQNLGVAASSSIGMFNEQTLWGIVACHHVKDTWLHSKTREAISLIVDFASQRYFYLEQFGKHGFQKQVHRLRDNMAQDDLSEMTPEQLFEKHAQGWLRLINAIGCSYVQLEGEHCSLGEVPGKTGHSALVNWLNTHVSRLPYWSTRNISDHLGEPLPPADQHLAGLLAVPMFLQGEQAAWLLFFRAEQIEVRSWAGKPEKQVYKGATGDMLGPRKSFAMWQQTVEGLSETWREEELYAARDLARDLLIVADSMRLQQLNEVLADMNVQLKQLAEHDDLTGIWNRRFAEQRLNDIHQQSRRYGHPYTLLLLDLDHFKQINDQHGHTVGDEILQAVCTIVAEQIRETDLFARWGGEEFLLIAPNTTMEEASELAERIRSAIENYQHNSLPQVTSSIGVADYQQDASWGNVLERADKAMYQAKQSGRNRVAKQ